MKKNLNSAPAVVEFYFVTVSISRRKLAAKTALPHVVRNVKKLAVIIQKEDR